MFKNIFLGLFVFLFMFIGVVNAHGGNDVVTQKPIVQNSAGLLPGDFFYFLDVFSEKIGTLFTFGDIPNIKRRVYLAGERLDEAQKLSSLGRDKDAGIAVKKYQVQIDDALNRAKVAKKDGKNTDLVLSSIAEKTVGNQTILANIYDKVASSEKNTVKDAMKNSMKGYESALGEISKKKQVEIKPKIDKLLGDINKELIGLKNEGKNFPEVKIKYMNNVGEFSDMENIGNRSNSDHDSEKEISKEGKSGESENGSSEKEKEVKSSESEKDGNENNKQEDNGSSEKESNNSESDGVSNNTENNDHSRVSGEMEGASNGSRRGGMFDN